MKVDIVKKYTLTNEERRTIIQYLLNKHTDLDELNRAILPMIQYVAENDIFYTSELSEDESTLIWVPITDSYRRGVCLKEAGLIKD